MHWHVFTLALQSTIKLENCMSDFKTETISSPAWQAVFTEGHRTSYPTALNIRATDEKRNGTNKRETNRVAASPAQSWDPGKSCTALVRFVSQVITNIDAPNSYQNEITNTCMQKICDLSGGIIEPWLSYTKGQSCPEKANWVSVD